ncbi:N-acetylmuramoyl-L-alanine amidase family protein [Stackebrandtia nassauensis]|uniref:Cell wall hydrolase/autolysin n=1 Tax=Stackebrandtia nassauensis (strain DSM 44728 / CIP 108903 / NRRL B-16338 / NBRC 102104 / LLR-40K-21) TaxID=446470 RepID=D3PXA7_STANL|nr:N-acetylmuramoyl-L-alanine amidase [Stackebrandtia nassauensis]ADD41370.1 cell wall hydrolase/autolysin [Stackebrandtia nassauensis DSM 44728]
MPKTIMTRRNVLLAGITGLVAAPLVGGIAMADAAAKVYIDPGHGGSDSGAVGHGLQEKALTLDISLRLRDLLNANGNVEVRMSRDTDIDRSLSYRTSDANSWGAGFFISVHINSGGGTGFESYRYTGTTGDTQRAQETIHPAVYGAMTGVGQTPDRGIKTANFHVLRETAMPAVLTENLFIDRAEDAALLGNADFIAAVAQGHANGILSYLGV